MTDQNHTFSEITSNGPAWLPPGYTEQSDGIYFQSQEDGDSIFVCTPLRVIASFADSGSKGWGQLVTVTDPAYVTHEIPILNELLDGPQQKVIAQLAKLGLKVGSDTKAKKLLIELLKLSEPQKHMTSVTQPGWVDDDFRTFSFGRTAFGQRAVLPLHEGASQRGSAFVSVGTLECWKSELGEKCRGNPMMILAVSLAFSAPLLNIVGLDGGGIHFRGQSSSGKSTLLRLAASVWGSPSLVNQWRATSNGLEALAASYNDLLLPLDELSEITPRHLNETIYMLSHGKAKTRMSKDIAVHEAATWRVALISSGELSVREHLASANLEIREGQEVRLIDTEADTRTHGVFDEIYGAPDPGRFAAQIQEAASKNFGLVGHSFLEKLVVGSRSKKFRDQLKSKIAEYQEIILSHLSGPADSMAGRVAKRFALIGLAGELATAWGLTGWAKEEAKDAALEAFRDWHDRWEDYDEDVAQGPMRKLKDFLSAQAADIVDANTFAADPSKLGFTFVGRICLPETVWRSLFPNSTGQEAARQLASCRVLVKEGRHLQRRGPHLIPGRPRFYTVDPQRLKLLLPK